MGIVMDWFYLFKSSSSSLNKSIKLFLNFSQNLTRPSPFTGLGAGSGLTSSTTGPTGTSGVTAFKALQSKNISLATLESALASVKGDDVVLVVGSFHTVGEVLEHWQKKGN